MTKQIMHQNGQVLQWQDTDQFNYAEPPEGAVVIGVSEEEWAQQAALKWVRDGVLTDVGPVPLVESAPVPRSITKAQGQAQLAIEGKYQAVVDYIAAIVDPTQRLLAEIAFNATNDWMIDSPFLNQAATDLGWMEDPGYLNVFFTEASKIKL